MKWVIFRQKYFLTKQSEQLKVCTDIPDAFRFLLKCQAKCSEIAQCTSREASKLSLDVAEQGHLHFRSEL